MKKTPAMPGAIRKTEPPWFFFSTRGRDKDRILYGLAILLMAASMAGEEDARPGRKENHDYKIYRSGQMSKLRENGIER